MGKPILNDHAIRTSLIARLSGLSKAPKAVLQEIRVHNGNAIADVVALHSEAHCYEIKGETDSVQRIMRQGSYYDVVFRRTTLVTTENQIRSALRLAPQHWGIMKAHDVGGKVKITYVRRARPSPTFDKKLALLTLWKSELVEVARSIPLEKAEKLNRSQLSNLIASALPADVVGKNISDKLTSRRS